METIRAYRLLVLLGRRPKLASDDPKYAIAVNRVFIIQLPTMRPDPIRRRSHEYRNSREGRHAEFG